MDDIAHIASASVSGNIDTAAAIVKTEVVSETSLNELERRIRAAHADVASAFSSAVERAIEAGRALLAAEDLIPHGQKSRHYKRCGLGDRQAERYKKLAGLAVANPTYKSEMTGLSIEEAIKRLSPPKPSQGAGERGQSREHHKPERPAPTKTTHLDIIAAFIGAVPGERTKAINSIGLKPLLAVLPAEWIPEIEAWLADRKQISAPAIAAVLPSDLSIPTLLQREQPKLIAPAEVAPPLVTPVYDTGHGSAYCRPTAMSAISGEPISAIRDAIRQASGKIARADGSAWPVAGITNEDMLAAMQLLGWHVAEQWSESKGGKPYTLDAFAKDHGDDGPFIVNVTGHYVAISQNEFCDTATVLPKDLFGGVLDRRWFDDRKRKGSTWVRAWWRFEKLPAVITKESSTRTRISKPSFPIQTPNGANK